MQRESRVELASLTEVEIDFEMKYAVSMQYAPLVILRVSHFLSDFSPLCHVGLSPESGRINSR